MADDKLSQTNTWTVYWPEFFGIHTCDALKDWFGSIDAEVLWKYSVSSLLPRICTIYANFWLDWPWFVSVDSTPISWPTWKLEIACPNGSTIVGGVTVIPPSSAKADCDNPNKRTVPSKNKLVFNNLRTRYGYKTITYDSQVRKINIISIMCYLVIKQWFVSLQFHVLHKCARRDLPLLSHLFFVLKNIFRYIDLNFFYN